MSDEQSRSLCSLDILNFNLVREQSDFARKTTYL